MTERTYKKDLNILYSWFQDELPPDYVLSLQPLFQLIESMIGQHNVFLRDLEHRLLLWEGRGAIETNRIGDILLKNMAILPVYDEYVENHRHFLERLQLLYDTDEMFQQIYREFEQQKICYIPIGSLILKPLHRLLHYQIVLESKTQYDHMKHLRTHPMPSKSFQFLFCRFTFNFLQKFWIIFWKITSIELIVRQRWQCYPGPQTSFVSNYPNRRTYNYCANCNVIWAVSCRWCKMIGSSFDKDVYWNIPNVACNKEYSFW